MKIQPSVPRTVFIAHPMKSVLDAESVQHAVTALRRYFRRIGWKAQPAAGDAALNWVGTATTRRATELLQHEVYGGECKAGGILTNKDVNTARLAHRLGFRAFFFTTTRAFHEQSRQLIEAFRQEIAQSNNDGHPFDLFVLDGPILFAEQALPLGIPQ